MSAFLRAFNKILDQRQRETMAYRPQANGSAERMVHTITRALKMYVQDLDQQEITHSALPSRSIPLEIRSEENTILHGSWLGSEIHPGDGDPDGKYNEKRSGSAEMAISDPEALPAGTRASQSAHTGNDLGSGGSAQQYTQSRSDFVSGYTWIGYGYAKKLAHLWHGPFRVTEKIGEYAVSLEIDGPAYKSSRSSRVEGLSGSADSTSYGVGSASARFRTKHFSLEIAGSKIVIQMNTKSRGSRICQS
ncbi:LOW QUALITY PROTEIN: reverse transcriptase [Phytophthora megakarya]|uniref:Reverse transcriptase n=1 Tax=Phytophthora megakarya TaxID=4795 RepID=A0A225WEW9_9STRA|nr:LOW QUALITY PROTEIN: reverse transcriptase [Phytophthora megakarya]